MKYALFLASVVFCMHVSCNTAHASCTKDTDCEENLVCENYSCIQPEAFRPLKELSESETRDAYISSLAESIQSLKLQRRSMLKYMIAGYSGCLLLLTMGISFNVESGGADELVSAMYIMSGLSLALSVAWHIYYAKKEKEIRSLEKEMLEYYLIDTEKIQVLDISPFVTKNDEASETSYGLSITGRF